MEQDLYLHGLIGGTPAAEPLWTRPADWLVVPELELTDDKVQILYTIVPNTTQNYLAFVCTGNYTVDWGDGNTENVASGVKAQHQYDWNDIDPLTLTSDGFLQALVVITPNGGVLSTVNFEQEHSSTPTGGSNLLIFEVVANCPSATYLKLNYSPNVTRHIILGAHNVTNWDFMCGVIQLERFECKGDMSNVTTMQDAFNQNESLVEVVFTNPDFSSCTDFSFMFIGCTRLTKAPEMNFNPTPGTNITLYRMFLRCYSLTEIPLYNLLGVQDFGETFKDCWALTVVPFFDTSNVSWIYNTFQFCYSLPSIPEFDTSSCESFDYMLDYTRVQTVPAFDMSNAESAYPNSSKLFSDNSSTYAPIKTFNATGMNGTFTLQGSSLDRDNIINVFNNLASGVVAKTITITGNPGTASLTGPDLAIATGRGWTVVT